MSDERERLVDIWVETRTRYLMAYDEEREAL